MILTDFNADNYFNYIKNNKITLISMVPSMLQKIIERTPQSKIPKSLKAVVLGGSEINIKKFDIITKYQIPAYIAYGMSETTSGIAGFWYHHNKPKRYMPHDGIDINLHKSKIMITGDTVMKGYLSNKNLNGTFISNDIGEVYTNLSFKIQNRQSSIVNYGGEIISPESLKKFPLNSLKFPL